MARAAAVRKEPETEPYGAKAPVRANPDAVRKLNSRLASLEQQRQPWWVHWGELARYILPRRYRWLVQPGDQTRGSPINQNIIDSTGTRAARKLAAGMTEGTTSPMRPWFQLGPVDPTLADDAESKAWYHEVTTRMLRVLAASNYYSAKAQQYMDEAVFGTAPMIIYEDYDTVIRCMNPCAGEYYCAVGAKGAVDALFRKITMTVSQIVDEFGKEAGSLTVQTAWTQGGAALDRDIIVCHAIEPNPDFVADTSHIGPGGLPRNFRYMETYWELGATEGKFLRRRGFIDKPFSCPRWDVTGNDAYGRSPGMDALGDIKQLQLEQKRKGQAIDKGVNPPMVADAQMKNEPASLLPGAVTYTRNGSEGFKPAFQPALNLRDLKEDIQEVRASIEDTFFVPVFLMISSLDTVRSATEIDARRAEQLIQLGPVLGRNEAEGLAPDIERVFKVMMRAGLFPPAPPAVRNAGAVKVQFVSILAAAQQAAATVGIERLWGFAGSVAAAQPQVMDNLNADEGLKEYALKLNTAPRLLNSPRTVSQMRKARQQQQEGQAAMAAADAGVQGAKVLSETETGAGQNALQMMLAGG